MLGGLADRQQPLLRALAEDPQLLGLEIEGAEVEDDYLLAAQAAGVGELEHRPVAELERGPAGIRSSSVRTCSPLITWGSLVALRAGDEVGRVLADPLGADEESKRPRIAASLRATVAGAEPAWERPAA